MSDVPAREPDRQHRSEIASRLLLPLLCSFSFALSLSNGLLSPILPRIGDDFGVSVTAAGQLATVSMFTCAVAALITGTLSDTYGRRRFLVGGLLVIGLGALGTSLAPTFGLALLSRGLGGLGFVMAVALALAGDSYAGKERDRAASRMLAAEALAWLAGVPIVAVAAQLVGWRAVVGGFGVLAMGVAVLGRFALPHGARSTEVVGFGEALAGIWRQHRDRPDLVLVLVANGLRNTFWVGLTTYAGAFYAAAFGLATWQLGPVLALSAAFFIAGTEAGGRLVARFGSARLTAVGCGGMAVLGGALPLVSPLPLSLCVLVAACVCGGAVNSALIAWILRLAGARRGATLALNSALTNAGAAVGAASCGAGILVLGYPGLGLVVAFFAVLGAGAAFWSTRFAARIAERST